MLTQALLQNTVFDAKRLIGRRFSDTSVQEDMKHWPFTVVSAPDGKPNVVVNYKGESKTFSPEEISSMVLVKMCVPSRRCCRARYAAAGCAEQGLTC